MAEIEKALTTKDYASTMKLIWTTSQKDKVAANYQNVVWNKFKNGTKNRTFFEVLDKAKQYESKMQFDLESEAEINEI